MATKKKTSSQASHAGEMGHEGRDRQPARTGVRGIVGDAPEPHQVARPQEVMRRTKDAKLANTTTDAEDGLPTQPHVAPVKKPTPSTKNTRG